MQNFITVFIMIFIICSIFCSIQTPIYAALGDGFDPSKIANDSSQTPVFTEQFNKVWNTVIYIARVLAFVGIFVLGLTYIFANSDKKADLKKGLVPVIIGIVIFFGSTYVIDFIKRIFQEIS